ncbi:MAG TPA: alpha/beta fold hydrolase [Pseudonocardia sp.]|nr:alpha/beta fold hydrolase [Pseudonocardia sp.]
MNRRNTVVAAIVVVLVAAGAVALLRESGSAADRVPTQVLRIDTPTGPGRSDTISLDATLYLPKHTPAPAVLVAHGFGGSKDSIDADARDLAARGFVALAWSARGFGASGGQIALDAPDAEVADGSRLIDYLATRPEVRLDHPGDPRVGVTGASYGGALSLLLASYDKRVDAIVPVITWNDLGQALFPNDASAQPPPVDTPARTPFGPDGVFKRGWASIFFASGLNPQRRGGPAAGPQAGAPGQGGAGGLAGAGAGGSGTGGSGTADQPASGDTEGEPPAGSTQGAPGALPGDALPAPAPDPTSCGRFVPEICQAFSRAATTGRLDAATAQLMRRSSPTSVAGRITAPTMLVQGESDTLFGLDQADATARQIAASGGVVRVVWYSGGHDGGAPGPTVRDQIGAWFDRYLGDPAGSGPKAATTDAAGDPNPGAQGGLDYAVQSGIRAGRRTSTVRTVTADRYPGLSGDPVQLVPLHLTGPPRSVLNPPGGYPAAITTVPGVSGSLGSLAGRLTALGTDLPGQAATFATDPMPAQLLVAGAPRIRITVAPVPGQPSAPEAVLFGRLSEISADGRRTLLGGAVAPMRIPMGAGGAPTEVTVTLPAVVAPVETGHRLVVSISTTDQSFLGAADVAVWRVSMAGDGILEVPVVPGRAVTANTVPAGPALGIAGILLALVGAMIAARVVRRRARSAEERGLGPDDGLPLVVEDLAKRYPGGITAVDGVSFQVRPNQVVGLLGPNGAGKTTVLRMLMGLILPSSGELRVFGHRVAPGAEALSRVGSFVEGPGFLPHLSGDRNLRLYWAATGRPQAESHLEEVLEIAGLGAASQRAVRTYSQGMRQRLAIAQAMLGQPDLLVLDEPTNGLDPPQIHAMRDVLRRYARDGRAVLVSSHLLAEVEQTCDHVVVMHRGRVVADGDVAEIVAGGGQASFRVDDPERAAQVLGDAVGVDSVEVQGPTVHADLNGMARSDAVGRLVRAGVSVESAGPRRRLEDAFLALVGEDSRP